MHHVAPSHRFAEDVFALVSPLYTKVVFADGTNVSGSQHLLDRAMRRVVGELLGHRSARIGQKEPLSCSLTLDR